MPPSQTPRKPPTWWLKKAKPNSIVSQRVPNISATRPEVGGTVESQIRPVDCAERCADVVDSGTMMKTAIDSGPREIEERRGYSASASVADPAGGERADDVEQADDRDHPAADLRRQAAVDQIGRQMRGDEGELEAAGEEAEHQQHIGAVRERLGQAPGAAIAVRPHRARAWRRRAASQAPARTE